ncbi:MAG TPA: tyrosine decarboxylase MfnA [candidate division Zixibacteria bacterium]|nr:tyrosine decarboxylase MfnA [candidate division Zixibacteria bacterium]
MQVKGLPEKTVFEELESRLRGDFTFDSGRIVGSMCTVPNPLARKVYARFLDKNLGDPGLFPAVAEIERETLKMLGTVLSNPEASGHIVTGGTEANVLALWAARALAKKTNPEVIVPASAHCSFDKAGDLLGIRIVKARLNERFQVDVASVKKAVSSKTIALVGMAGTTALGVVDPIDDLSELALEKNLYFHVDAAFGGFVLPFLRDLGYDVPSFDFAVPGVCSITVDPHKMGLAPIPAGGIVFRNESFRRAVSWGISYLSGGETEQTTLVGTRSGASAIAVWAVMKHLGREGYRKIVRKCMRLTIKLAGEIPKIRGLSVVTEPTMNVVGLRSDSFDIRRIAEELRLRKWAISLFPRHIRIVLMPHIQEKHVDEFLQDLNKIVIKL